jgi:deoxyribodipyrimidine photo-lyase
MLVMMIERRRSRLLKTGAKRSGPLLYWMSRDQRAVDNPALWLAREEARWEQSPLVVVFCLVPEFLGATRRAYDFMLRGLEEVENELRRLNIPFLVRPGDPCAILPALIQKLGAAKLVTDFNPLRIKTAWEKAISAAIPIPFIQVDAHNVIPCWTASPKQEYGAYTIRPKIHRLLSQYLDDLPEIEPMSIENYCGYPPNNWADLHRQVRVDETVGPVDGVKPGSVAAAARLREFLRSGIKSYADGRNDPNLTAQSELSPYLHFGQISPHRVAFEVTRADLPGHHQEAFLEELIVRRELSDNFCLYQPRYDEFAAFTPWARQTLDEHRADPREFVYDLPAFDAAATREPLWNAAQNQLRRTGKLHGYMRMYWAKKILEWSAGPEEALHYAIWLNDRYSLDGRDPNGYTGVAWSIGGLHDRAWRERPVFGKIRYMNANGCARKFDAAAYIARWLKEA